MVEAVAPNRAHCPVVLRAAILAPWIFRERTEANLPPGRSSLELPAFTRLRRFAHAAVHSGCPVVVACAATL